MSRPAAAPDFDTVRGAWRPSDAWLLDRHGAVIDRSASISPCGGSSGFRSRRCRRRWSTRSSPARTSVSGATAASTGAASPRRCATRCCASRRRGASTITMQLAQLLPQTRVAGAPDWWRKLRAGARRARPRAPLEQAADPRGLPQPARIPRRAAGHRRRGGGARRQVADGLDAGGEPACSPRCCRAEPRPRARGATGLRPRRRWPSLRPTARAAHGRGDCSAAAARRCAVAGARAAPRARACCARRASAWRGRSTRGCSARDGGARAAACRSSAPQRARRRGAGRRQRDRRGARVRGIGRRGVARGRGRRRARARARPARR